MSCYLMEEEEIGAIAVANFRGITYDSNGRFYNPVTKKVEYINACLLYTSPSPRDGLLSRMPSSA